MRVGPIVHGALLAGALVFAYQTWTRDKNESPKVGVVSVWQESLDDFESFAYDGDKKSVNVEVRHDGKDAYYWGKVTRTEKKAKPRVPVKAPDESGEGEGGHGAPGGHGGASRHGVMGGQGTPALGPGGTGPARPGPTPGPGAKSAPPASKAGGTGDGSATKPPPQQSLSPHHAGTDQQTDKPATPPARPAGGTTPAKPAGGTTPAKPAGGTTPAKPAGGTTPAKPARGTTPAKPGASGGESSTSEETDTGEETADDEGTGGAPAAAPPEETTSKTKEFPVGKTGTELIANLVNLHALRELGVLTDKQKEEYDLTDSKENLTVFFKGGKKHTLIIGSRVYGGGDRYVMNADNGKGYVLSNSEIMRHIDGAENSLGLKDLHRFQEDQEDDEPNSSVVPSGPKPKKDRYAGVREIEVETPDGTRTLLRHEQKDAETGGTIAGWADKQKPGEADMTFGNFLSQVERLKPTEYDQTIDLSKLTKVMTLRYKNSDGKAIGTFELYRKEAAVTPELEPSDESKKENQPEYFVKTELTRVAGKLNRMSAERVTDDIPELFGAPPKKKEGRPTLKEPGVVKPHGASTAPGGADNHAKPAPDKQVPGKAAAGSTPSSGAAAKPAGSKPNPTEGNK
ncbi:MAG TPA: hypothetical protein VKB80_36610 [Kofleriaceae bacterium]|nr:hypothetical protein [Kofleriaceae bacterium]